MVPLFIWESFLCFVVVVVVNLPKSLKWWTNTLQKLCQITHSIGGSTKKKRKGSQSFQRFSSWDDSVTLIHITERLCMRNVHEKTFIRVQIIWKWRKRWANQNLYSVEISIKTGIITHWPISIKIFGTSISLSISIYRACILAAIIANISIVKKLQAKSV